MTTLRLSTGTEGATNERDHRNHRVSGRRADHITGSRPRYVERSSDGRAGRVFEVSIAAPKHTRWSFDSEEAAGSLLESMTTHGHYRRRGAHGITTVGKLTVSSLGASLLGFHALFCSELLLGVLADRHRRDAAPAKACAIVAKLPTSTRVRSPNRLPLGASGCSAVGVNTSAALPVCPARSRRPQIDPRFLLELLGESDARSCRPALFQHRPTPFVSTVNHLATATAQRGRLQPVSVDHEPQLPANLYAPQLATRR